MNVRDKTNGCGVMKGVLYVYMKRLPTIKVRLTLPLQQNVVDKSRLGDRQRVSGNYPWAPALNIVLEIKELCVQGAYLMA